MRNEVVMRLANDQVPGVSTLMQESICEDLCDTAVLLYVSGVQYAQKQVGKATICALTDEEKLT